VDAVCLDTSDILTGSLLLLRHRVSFIPGGLYEGKLGRQVRRSCFTRLRSKQHLLTETAFSL
jgi:hypothetical protein